MLIFISDSFYKQLYKKQSWNLAKF